METPVNISLSQSRRNNRINGPFSFRLKNAEIYKKSPVIFLVDDDPLYLRALELAVSSQIGSAKIHSFQTASACLNEIKLKPDAVILDYYLDAVYPDAKNGIDVLREIKKSSPRTKVIMLSAQDSLNIAIDCMENGAYDYVSKSQSSFIRINNLLSIILGDSQSTSLFFRILQLILFIIFLVIVASALLNH
ncbi:MAG TPA: response regulator [Bacteroidia bacterium]|jgi:DNA-binding NtrC family response regulator